MLTTFSYGHDKLTAGKALQLANGEIKGIIDADCRERIAASRKIVDEIAEGEKAVYGINTGFGPLCDTRISPEDTRRLQVNILKSHSVGVGETTPRDIAKLMLILKIHALCQGYSGVAISTLERMVWHVENDAIPCVPQQGSVGASGDLAPLAHLFLPLIGLGRVHFQGEIIETDTLFSKLNISCIQLGAKEGLALINGTQFIAAYATKVISRMHSCLSQADLIGALMVDGLLGSASPFLDKLHSLRPFNGNQHVAFRLSALLRNSCIKESHKDCDRVQDPYSLRCIPQVHGASRTSWLHLKELLEIELNAVTDNPVIIDKNLSISGGNFHGQPLALPLDYACLGASEVGSISDRRTYLSLTGIADNVPRLLMSETGTNSGFMMTQYTAAALASENKGLCFPASSDSIPTSLGQEDHVSMGSIAGRKALRVIENLEKILAIELLHAAQAFDFHAPLRSGNTLNAVYDHVRSKVTFATEDRVFHEDITACLEIVRSGALLEIAREQGPSDNLVSPFEEAFETY